MIPVVICIIIVAVVVLVITGGVFVARKKKRKSRPAADAGLFRTLLNVPPESAAVAPPSAGASDTPEAEKLRQNLRVKLLYQDDKIDEALAFERERNPDGSMTELLRSAVERWERDNR